MEGVVGLWGERVVLWRRGFEGVWDRGWGRGEEVVKVIGGGLIGLVWGWGSGEMERGTGDIDLFSIYLLEVEVLEICDPLIPLPKTPLTSLSI